MVDFLWEEFLQIPRKMHAPHSIVWGQVLLYEAIHSPPFSEHTLSSLTLLFMD